MIKNILANSFIIFLLLIVNSNKLTAQLYGSFPYNESFTSGVQPSEITILTPQSGVNSTTFTTNGMRLTAAVNGQFGAVYINNKQFASSNGIKIEFEYGMYGGTGADGLSFFLFDAAVASPVVGARGAGLGYGYTRANNSFSTNRESGLTGGYLGVGLDAFGNFKSQVYQGDRRMNGVQTAFTQPASQITLRGKVGTLNLPNGLGLGYTGYPVLATQSTLSGVTAAATINPATGAYTTAGGLAENFSLRTATFTTNPNNNDYRKAFIELIPNAGGGFNVTVKIQHGTTVTTVINNYWYRTSYVYTENANPVTTDFNTLDTQGANTTQTLNTSVPTNFRIGFGASNGGLNDIHLIRGLKITLPYSAISNNDSFTTCKNSSATIDPLTNDLAYSGPITGTPTASSSNIDPNSFQFIDAAGTPQGTSYTQSGVGTWTYAAATKLVTFSPVTGYTGVATIRYNIKGLTAPYNDDGYRSEPATITATVNNCFGCTSALYLSQTNSLYEVVTSSNPLTYPLIGTASVNYNSTAINPLNGVMYGIQTPTSNVLVSINADGTSVNLGAVSGLPTGVTYNSGEIDNLGNYYVKVNTNNNQLYKINLSTLTASLITLSASINVPDIAFNITNGLLYGVNSTNGQLVSINPTTAVVTAIGITPGAVNFGAMFASSTGEMYGVDNLGGFYQFNLTTGQRVLISNAPASSANDGAHCVTAPISFSADLAITKTDGKDTYKPGTTNTYTVVVSNNGPFGVLGATVSDPLPAGIPSGNVSYTIPVVTGGATTSIASAQTGALNDVVNLPVGGTITYTVNITIPSSFTGDLVNVATVTPPANSTDSTSANNTATDTDSSACVISATNPDSDGDGISDFCDLDDDNDGILDTVECPPTYLVRPVTSSSVTADKPITSGTAPQIADGEGAGGTGDGPFPNWYTNVSNLPIAFSMNMQSSSTIDHIKLYGPWGFNEWIGNFTIELYNAGNTLLGTENFVAPDQYTGTPIFSFTKEYTNVTRVRFTIVSSQGYSNVTPPRASVNEIVFLDLQPLTCDTDGDGIPNHLDLDSDNDGCVDAFEGDENVTNAQLTTASGTVTVGIGSTASNQNLGTIVNANGVPTVVNSGGAADIGSDLGQGIGSSTDATVNNCFCYKPAVLDTGNTYPSKHGITTLARAGADNENWPMVRQSAWTVLESKEKGFVVNRVATTSGLANITNPVEGMMVYDEEADCLKIYTLKSGDTLMGWHCFITPTCPD